MPAITPTPASDSSVVPVPIAPLTVPTISSIAIDGGTAPSSGTIASGGIPSTLIVAVNDHAARVDLATQVFTGLPSVVDGMTLSAGSGLVLNVAAGHVSIKGVKEYAGGTITLTASATSRVWIDQTGAILSGTGTYTPSNPACYLGSVTCSGSAITAIDTSGVFKLVGGIPVRTVTDTFKVTTAPTAGSAVHITKTTNGTWFWDGTAYNLMVPASKITTLSSGSTTAQIVDYLQSLGLAL